MTDDDLDLEGGPSRPSRDLDRDETIDDSGAGPDRSRTYRFFSWLERNLLKFVAVLGLFAFVVGSILGVSIPRNLHLIGVSGLLSMALIGVPVARKVKSMLWDPSIIWLIDLDARVFDGAIWRMPSQRFREWDVEDGELDWLTPNLAVGKDVNPEEQTVEGVWRGTLSDRELLIAVENVKRLRGNLEKRAQKGDVLESTGWIVVRNTVSRYVRQVTETFERGSLPDDGEALTDEINDALEQFGMDRSLDDLVDDDPAEDVAGDATLGDLADDLDVDADDGAEVSADA
jgi:hypothetical protein